MASIRNRSIWQVRAGKNRTIARDSASRRAAESYAAQFCEQGVTPRVRQALAGRWQARIRRLGHPDLVETFPTRAAAEAWSVAREADIASARFVDYPVADRKTLGSILDRYLTEITPTKRGCKDERRRLTKMRRHPLCSMVLARLDSSHLAARQEWSIHLPDNVAGAQPLCRPKNLDGRRTRRLERGEEEVLMRAVRACKTSLLAEAVQLAIETAMRRGELLTLPWEKVDLTQRIARVFENNGQWRLVHLSEAAVRIIDSIPEWAAPVSPDTLDGHMCPEEQGQPSRQVHVPP